MKANENYCASYDVELAKIVGISASALFNKLTHFSKRTKRKDKMCWLSFEKAEDDLGLTRKNYETARKELIKHGLIKEKVTYIEGTMTRCIHFKVLKSDISETPDSYISETPEMDIPYNSNNTYSKREKRERKKNFASLKTLDIGEFEKLCLLYETDNPSNDEECFNIFIKYQNSEREKIFKHVVKYMRLTPERKYRMSLFRYLSNEEWKNEIVDRRKTKFLKTNKSNEDVEDGRYETEEQRLYFEWLENRRNNK